MPRLFTRFDNRALTSRPLTDGPLPAPPQALLDWCRREPAQAWAWRLLTPPEAEPAGLEALLRELDGDRALQALRTPRERLALRLGLKWREALGKRRADDPWDCGLLREEVAAWSGFRPRRPTLIVASAAQAQAGCREVLAHQATRAANAHCVLRLLIRP